MVVCPNRRWSAIAARLPGRTDNEIKNVWHTHLKKRVKEPLNFQQKPSNLKEEDVESLPSSNSGGYGQTKLNSPQHSYSEISSIIAMDKCDFWSLIFSSESSGDFTTLEQGYKSNMHDDMQFWFSVLTRGDELSEI